MQLALLLLRLQSQLDKQQHLSKFEQKNPTLVQFDSRLQSYSRVVQDAQAMQQTIGVDFIEIYVGTLLHDLQEHAKGWVTAIAKLMNQMVRQELSDLHELILEKSASLDRDPDTLDDLKFILKEIEDIASRSMEIEMQYAALEEKYRTLRMYGYEVADEELGCSGALTDPRVLQRSLNSNVQFMYELTNMLRNIELLAKGWSRYMCVVALCFLKK